MKKLVNMLLAMALTIVAMLSASNLNAEKAGDRCGSASAILMCYGDGGDADLYLDCFENAVKSKDMELAAKIANILYSINMTDVQQKRFAKIEDTISKKDYRVYRDNLKYFASKPQTIQDGYYDFYVEPNGEQGIVDYGTDDESFEDDMIDAFSSFFNDLGITNADSSYSWHYERHDTIDGGGMYDVFVDAFSNFLYGGEGSEVQSKSAVDESEMDALLDDYENYVNLAVGALRNVMRGDEAAMNDFEKYSKEASALSEKLTKNGSGMTSKQFKRYMHIWGDMVNGLF